MQMRVFRPFATLTLSLAILSGCEVSAGPVAADVGFAPGYYYDDEYIDVGGVYHPRDYWYHDGNHFNHRDAIPVGAPARARFGFVHGAAPPAGHGRR